MGHFPGSRGTVFQFQRFSVHDGPGIRTTVFLKGCNNRCSWCHNPESIPFQRSIEFFPDRCIACGMCVEACTTGARNLFNGKIVYERDRCLVCGKCAEVCWVGAINLIGTEMTVEEVVRELLADRIYYNRSGGGVTLSGGEPFMQKDFSLALLQALKHEGIHTAVQTAGAVPYSIIEQSLPWIDLIMFDIKGYTQDVYKEHVGSDRDLVYRNLERLLTESSVSIAVRTPLVGGVNDSPQEIREIAKWLGTYKDRVLYFQLIPYHSLGVAKYERLGYSYDHDFYTPERDAIKELERIAAEYVSVKENI